VQQAQQGISTTNSSHAGHFVHSGEQSPRVVAPNFRLDDAFTSQTDIAEKLDRTRQGESRHSGEIH
jgi:hypothetical protein